MLLLTLLAHALPPAPAELEQARPFRLAEPVPYRHQPTPIEVRDGWLLQLRVDPRDQRASDAHLRTLFVGPTLAVRTNFGSSCAVVWVPGEIDFATARVFHGPVWLPEEVGPARIREALAAASHLPPVGAPARVGEPLELAGHQALLDEAARWADACR